MQRFLIFFLILLSTNTWSQNYEVNKGDWILRSGYTFLVPQFNNDSQVGMAIHGMPTFSFSYLMTDNLGVEFLTGIPSEIDIYNKTLGEEAKIASFISLSPNATVQYYFKPKDSDFRPYIGLGLIYSSFHKEKSLGKIIGGISLLILYIIISFVVVFTTSICENFKYALKKRGVCTCIILLFCAYISK